MRGFTLVELLIVMVLIGVMGGMAVLAMGQSNQNRRAEMETKRLAGLLELAEQEAWIAGEVIGLELSGGGYRFWQWRNDAWRQPDDGLFQPRQLSPLILGLQLDGEITPLPARAGVSPQPQIVLTPDGDGGEFKISIGDDLERFWLENGDGSGLKVASGQEGE